MQSGLSLYQTQVSRCWRHWWHYRKRLTIRSNMRIMDCHPCSKTQILFSDAPLFLSQGIFSTHQCHSLMILGLKQQSLVGCRSGILVALALLFESFLRATWQRDCQVLLTGPFLSEWHMIDASTQGSSARALVLEVWRSRESSIDLVVCSRLILKLWQ